MTIPTMEEIDQAIAAITADGQVRHGGGEVTIDLVMLMMVHPVLREAMRRKVAILKVIMDGNSAELKKLTALDPLLSQEPFDLAGFIEGFVSSLTVYGLNIGLRIGEARRGNMKSRSYVENLLSHYESGQCADLPETSRDAVMKIMKAILNEGPKAEVPKA